MTCFITVNDRHRIERKVYKPEEKMRIVMEGLSGAIEITELCRKYNIATSRFYDWKEKLVKNFDLLPIILDSFLLLY
ncbi:transposase [Ferroplasma sp.]|uniref:transposase n=1 Tax=Ferroplasma sp. TaxID=2591003 RepID=UPI0026277498|nr:transposase [Ferroplasma sp.]